MAKSMKLGGGGRFAALEAKLSKKGVKNPGAVAAKIGREKYGSEKFQALAAAGRRRAAAHPDASGPATRHRVALADHPAGRMEPSGIDKHYPKK
jgi:hypothetical protein